MYLTNRQRPFVGEALCRRHTSGLFLRRDEVLLLYRGSQAETVALKVESYCRLLNLGKVHDTKLCRGRVSSGGRALD